MNLALWRADFLHADGLVAFVPQVERITPFLWFDGQAEEAAAFYVSLLPRSRIVSTSRFPEGSPFPAGSVMSVEFELEGQRFVAINGGPQFSFTPAVSFGIACDTQAEIDRLWEALTKGGEEQPCGWLVDRFGLSWQVFPAGIDAWLSDPDPVVAARVWQTMMPMRKLDLAKLRDAHAG